MFSSVPGKVLSERLFSAADAMRRGTADDELADDASLITGAGGDALMYACVHAALPGAGFDDMARARALQAAAALRSNESNERFDWAGGTVGTVLALRAAQQLVDGCAHGLDTTAFDAALAQALHEGGWPAMMDADFMFGAGGALVYGSLHPDGGTGHAVVDAACTALRKRSRRDEAGVFWGTFPPPRDGQVDADSAEPEQWSDRVGSPHINLGVAHGVPGVVGALAGAGLRGLLPADGVSLLNDAIDWLLACERVDDFFCFSEVHGSAAPSRLAWCYGDATVALQLLRAAAFTRRDDAHAAALRAARSASSRGIDDSRTQGVGLCYGSAGLVQIFTCLHQRTDAAVFAHRRDYWLAHLLQHWPDPHQAPAHAAEPQAAEAQEHKGLLTGPQGVAMVLAGCVQPAAARWDELFLLSP